MGLVLRVDWMGQMADAVGGYVAGAVAVVEVVGGGVGVTKVECERTQCTRRYNRKNFCSMSSCSVRSTSLCAA
jgi:hypothetical protein